MVSVVFVILQQSMREMRDRLEEVQKDIQDAEARLSNLRRFESDWSRDVGEIEAALAAMTETNP